MKKLFTLIVIATIAIGLFAQAPQKMSYQAMIRNSSGELVKSNNVGMQISILQGSETGTAVYVETHTKMTNENGLVTLEIGSGTIVTGIFAEIDWSTGIYFIKTETDPTGGTIYSIEGTSQLLSVPYALYSKNAETAADKSYVDALQKQIDNLIDFINTQFPIPTNGLIAEWLFEDNLNDTKSIGTHFNLGLVQGGTSYISGKVGKALYLNGATKIENTSQDLVTFINNKNPWTISFWFKYKGGVIPYKMGAKHLISVDQSAYAEPYKRIWIGSGEFLTTQMKNDNFGSNVNLISNNRTDDDVWYYVTVIHNGSLLKLYINNILHEEKSSIDLGTDPLAAFVVGSCSQTDWATRDFYDGYVDQIRVYNRALTESEISVLFNEGNSTNTTITDIDGNSYKIVEIGNQVWMAENLNTTKYNDGSDIPNVIVDATWLSLTTGAYCNYSNTPANSDIYGRLYNWYAVNTGKLCPIGWHVPVDTEINQLIQFNGGESLAGGKLKENGTIHWVDENVGATNESGFTGLPGGARDNSGPFYNLNTIGRFWSSTDKLFMSLYNNNTTAPYYGGDGYELYGFSVRCIKDN
jgi:uncharacterized protein (TIGR02145 family)